MKKKLLFVITKAKWGGAGRYVYDLANALKDKYEVTVLLGGGEGPLGEKLEAAGIRTISAPSLARDIRTHQDIRAFLELKAIFRQEKPDIIHVNSSKAGGLGALAARVCGVKKIIYTVHGWAFNEPVHGRAKFFRFMASFATMLLSHRTVTVSHFDEMHSPFALKSVTVHNGIIPPSFHSRSDARTVLIGLAGAKESDLLMATIAELTKNKGLETLIEAFGKTHGGHLVIIGEGEDRQKLQSLIDKNQLSGRIHLVGFIDNAATLLKGFDMFILPSRKEGLPYVLLEAGSAELPVIAATVGGIPEIVDDQLSGVLIPPDDVAALSAIMQDLADSPATRQRYAANLKEKIDKNFLLSEMIRKTVEVYET